MEETKSTANCKRNNELKYILLISERIHICIGIYTLHAERLLYVRKDIIEQYQADDITEMLKTSEYKLLIDW